MDGRPDGGGSTSLTPLVSATCNYNVLPTKRLLHSKVLAEGAVVDGRPLKDPKVTSLVTSIAEPKSLSLK